MRLAGQEKMGYYPTPKGFIEKAFQEIDSYSSFLEYYSFDSGSVNILDPCAGEGDVLMELKASLLKRKIRDVKTYGIELDRNRYLKSKRKLDKVLNCDALNEAVIEEDKVNILFLNPPYDSAIVNDDEDSKRIEIEFLKKTEKYLCNSGILLYLVPLKSIQKAFKYFENYHNVFLLPLEKEEYKKFKQVLFVGVKKYYANYVLESEEWQSVLDIRDYEDYESIVDICKKFNQYSNEQSSPEKIQHSFYGIKIFYVEKITKDIMQKALERETDIIQKTLDKYIMVGKQKEKKLKPLTNLRKGHLAMLVAGGYLDGDLTDEEGNKYAIKGKILKNVTETEDIVQEGDRQYQENVKVTSSQICISVYDYQINDFYDVV